MAKTKTRRDALLKEISAEGTGVAFLMSVSLDPDKPDQTVDRFDEEAGQPDPIEWAWSLHRGIKDDFTDRLWSVVGNERAKFLQWQERMKALLGIDSTPEEYADL